MNKYLLLLLILLRLVPCLGAQEKQRIAIIPFNPVNVPKDQAEIIYTDFETSLIGTDAYVVIDRDEVMKLLGEGEQSLFSCTSDECGIDIASQLAGTQVVRGRLVKSSEGYTLEIRIVDVSDLRILFKDTVEARYLGAMRDLMELLAYRVAGLITIRNGSPTIAREFTQLFVETVPSRAAIYINGIRKGISPDLIDRIPVGRIKVAAQYGNFYGENTLYVTKDTREIRIECKEVYGSLSIKSDDNLDVYLDDRWLGNISTGPFNNLSVGIHTLELKGQGLYWGDEVVIRRNEQTVVNAQPSEYGSIEYGIPEGAIAEILGDSFREVVKGYGSLSVPVGRYSVETYGKNYEKHDTIPLSIVRGASVSLFPALQYTKDYEYQLFVDRIEEAERVIEYGYRVTNLDLQKLRELRNTIDQSGHGFYDLISRVDSLIEKAERLIGDSGTPSPPTTTESQESSSNLQLNFLLARKQELQLQLESKQLVRRKRVIGGWTSFGVGAAGVGLAGVFFFLGNEAYRSYQEAAEGASWAEAEKYKQLVQIWDISAISALGVGGVCWLVSSILWVSGPSSRNIKEELDTINTQIELLQK